MFKILHPKKQNPRKTLENPAKNMFSSQKSSGKIHPTIPGWWFEPLWNIQYSMGRIIPYIMEKKQMFETTKQIIN